MPERDDEQPRLTDERYRVCRLQQTEPPFTGAFWDHNQPSTWADHAAASPMPLAVDIERGRATIAASTP